MTLTRTTWLRAALVAIASSLFACGAVEGGKPRHSNAGERTASDDGGSGGGGSTSDNASTGGTPVAGAVAGGSTSHSDAGAGGMSEPNGGAPSMAGACSGPPDPSVACPDIVPQLSERCTAGAVCDYDVCHNGCIDTYFCGETGQNWSGAATVCGGTCEAPSARESPWTHPRTLIFANMQGDCGSLGSLAYDPVQSTLEALPCSLVEDEANDCSYRRKIMCDASGNKLTIEMRVAFFEGRGYRGTAAVETQNGALSCRGGYALGL